MPIIAIVLAPDCTFLYEGIYFMNHLATILNQRRVALLDEIPEGLPPSFKERWEAEFAEAGLYLASQAWRIWSPAFAENLPLVGSRENVGIVPVYQEFLAGEIGVWMKPGNQVVYTPTQLLNALGRGRFVLRSYDTSLRRFIKQRLTCYQYFLYPHCELGDALLYDILVKALDRFIDDDEFQDPADAVFNKFVTVLGDSQSLQERLEPYKDRIRNSFHGFALLLLASVFFPVREADEIEDAFLRYWFLGNFPLGVTEHNKLILFCQ